MKGSAHHLAMVQPVEDAPRVSHDDIDPRPDPDLRR